MDKDYSFVDLLIILKRRWRTVLLLSLLGLGIGTFVALYVMVPQYRMSSQFIINQTQSVALNEGFTVEDIRSNIELVNTYNVIIKSPVVLDEVRNVLDLKVSTVELRDKISVSNAEESQVVDVTVVDTSPDRAAAIANTTVQIFKESIPKLMNVDNVQILSKAEVINTTEPFSPNISLILLASLIGGAGLGGGVVLLMETYDTTIRKESEVIEILDVSFLGSVSNVSKKNTSRQKQSLPPSNTIEIRGESIGS